MKELINRGYAEEVLCQELNFNDLRVWYIPHHGLRHLRKPKKIRVGVNGNAVYEIESLKLSCNV